MTAPDAIPAQCTYVMEMDDDECVAMRPACCSAVPEPFNAMEEPFCRYCGKEIALDDVEVADAE